MSSWKLVVAFLLLFCASGVGSPVDQQAAPTSAASQSTEQNPAELKEYTLDPIETSTPIYPPAAKERKKSKDRLWGTILVAETGNVEGVYGFKGDPLLAAASEDAAKKWKFKPVMKDGQPLPVFATARRSTSCFLTALRTPRMW